MLDGSILGLLYVLGGIICFFIFIGIITLLFLLIKKCMQLRRHYLIARQEVEINYISI